MPKVSIIVPNYNHARYLPQRLESIFNQTYQDFEVVLLDDCSTDNSLEILKEYAKRPKVSHFIVNEKNSGSTYIQWERGIDISKGEFIWIAETDDYCEWNFLDTLVKQIDNNENIGIAFCKSNWIDAQGNIKKDLSIYHTSFQKEGIKEVRDELVYRNTIQNVSSAIIRKSDINDIKSQYRDLKACGDWIFYTGILLKSDLLFVGQPLNYFRWYHENTSNKSYITGLWIIEGINVVWLTNRFLKFTSLEKRKITNTWYQRILLIPLTRNSIKDIVIANIKLFVFSPLSYLKEMFNYE